jgi:hypothetical protein
VGGVDLHGDEAAMQNTAGRVWERHYCKQGAYHNEMVKPAIDRITMWRYEHLRRITAAAQPGFGEAGPSHG